MIIQLSKKGVPGLLQRLVNCAVLDHATVDSRGVRRRRHVAVAVGCLYCNVTSMAIQWHFKGNYTEFL